MLRFSITKALCLLTPLVIVETSPASDSPRPNIIIFLVDDMGIMDTSVPFLTGIDGKEKRYPLNDFYRTPNMERLASRGIRFNNFYAMSVCSPTRISIMTGQNAARHRTTNWINPEENNGGPQGPPDWNWNGLTSKDVLLPRILKANGYRTIHVGKGHFGSGGSEGANPRNLGFDVNIAGTAYGSPASYYGTKNYGNTPQKNEANARRAVPGLEKYHGTDTFLTEALTEEAKEQLTAAVANKTPFFLNFAHYAVHAPFDSDPHFASHYSASGKPLQAQAFATLIEGMDQSLGKLLDHLDVLGVAQNTIIFLLGDNGSDAPLGGAHEVASAAPLRGKKGSHYEGGMRVPFIAAWAKPEADSPIQKQFPIAKGTIQPRLAAVYDLFPTVLSIAGCSAPSNHIVDGRSLMTLLKGVSDQSHQDTFLMHYPHSPHRSDYFTVYRHDDWKVIYHYIPTEASNGSHYQLFNLANDPFEQHDLAESTPDELRRMMRELVDQLETEQAVYPVSPDRTTVLEPVLP